MTIHETLDMNPSPALIWSGKPLLLLLFIFLFSTLAFSADNAHAENLEPSSIASVDSAPVIVNGVVIFEVTGIRSYPARRRAKETAEKIQGLAENSANDVAMIRTAENSKLIRTEIYLGDQLIMSVYDNDAELQGFTNRPITAAAFAVKISESINSYRRDRTPAMIKKNIMLALARTAVVFVVLVALIWVFRRLDKLIDSGCKRRCM